MAEAYLIHDPVNGSFTGENYAFRLLQEQVLVHTYSSISIIAFILIMDVHHSICKCLIFPWTVLFFEIIMNPLATNVEHFAVERSFTLHHAVIRFHSDKHHSLFLADLRRLAAKKALASSRNSFFSFRRRISLPFG